MAKKKKDDLKPEDELLEEESTEEETEDTSNDDEENPEDKNVDEDSTEDESEEDDSTEDLISMSAYKGLQRTLAKKQKEVDEALDLAKKAQEDFDEYKASLSGDEVVRKDLQKNLADALKRLTAVEEENKTSKIDAMQSKVILKDFPNLAKLKEYIPEADTEEEYRKNVKKFAEDLGEKVTEALDKELDMTTETTEDEDPGVTQAHIDKLHAKVQSLAHPGMEEKYEKAMDEYMEALEKL